MTLSLQNLVASELQRYGLDPEGGCVEDLAAFITLLQRWGQRINLTGSLRAEDLVVRQLPDGLRLAAALHTLTWGRGLTTLVDVGAGPGTVGLVVARLCPWLGVTLVESNGRKCSFLRTAAHQFALPVQVLDQRLQELDAPVQSTELLCSRATWPPPQWLELAWPRVQPGGRVLAFVGRGDPPAPPAPLRLEQTLTYMLSDGTPRALAFYRRLD